MATLERLKQAYGPDRLRVAWEHFPLPLHKNARPPHLAAETVFRFGGTEAFWRFHQLAFSNQRSLAPESFEAWAAEDGVDRAAFRAAFEQLRRAPKVEQDIEAGRAVRVTGTLASFINRVFVSGAQPIDKLRTVVDEKFRTVVDEPLRASLAVNDYFLGGAQPAARFKRIMDRALGPHEPPPLESLHRSRAEPTGVDRRASGGAESNVPDRLLVRDRRRSRDRPGPRAQRAARVAVGVGSTRQPFSERAGSCAAPRRAGGAISGQTRLSSPAPV
ncbi:DsbA family protein [Sorangium sp. So ce1099]|uniref:DsbA family protein n=1 Tax=Sorangium sp. So ce1099 TaxID=3133331 RepID=UPI003F60F56F